MARRHRRLSLSVLVGPWLAAWAVLACGGDSASGPAPLGTGSTRDAGTGTTDLTLEASTLDAAGGELAFSGTLAATGAVPFGGNYADASNCTYTVTLKNVTIDLVVQDGQLVASAVHDQMVETTIGVCWYAAQDPNAQTFQLATAVASTSGGFHAEYLGASGNTPKASLVVDLTRDGDGYSASATWHRTDLGKPFDWTVTGTIGLLSN